MTERPDQHGARRLIYLHGFASSPGSRKAASFREALQARGWRVDVPDLNPEDFSRLTVGWLLARLERLVDEVRGPFALAGSSFGAWLAALHAARDARVEALVLMAPAMDLRRRWGDRLGDGALRAWERFGSIPIFHYALGRECPLGYEFWRESSEYPGYPRVPSRPQLVFHGRDDEVVPLQAAEHYCQLQEDAELVVFDDDHSLAASVDQILAQSIPFLEAKVGPQSGEGLGPA